MPSSTRASGPNTDEVIQTMRNGSNATEEKNTRPALPHQPAAGPAGAPTGAPAAAAAAAAAPASAPTSAPASAPASAPKKKHSQMRDVWRRYRKSPIAMLGLFIVIVMFLLAISADFIAPGDGKNPGYDIQDLTNRFQVPGRDHIMGTDQYGRDIFARVVHGTRVSLSVGFITVTISMITGVALGAIAGFFGGVSENLIMRTVDIILSIPPILLAISVAAALTPGLYSAVIAVGIGAIPLYARIMRASVLTVREQEFIEAAYAIGASKFRIISKHILPNCLAPIIVQATMGMGYAILWAAALSFLGLGIQPPTPEWGAMLSEGRMYILDYWHMVLFPGLSIALVIFALNMMGDGLRDALDPKLKK